MVTSQISASCGGCFARWQAHLEAAPELWMIRHLPTNEFWFNRTARAWVNVENQVMTWHVASHMLSASSVVPMEDAQSRAMKTGQQQEIIFKGRVRPHVMHRIHNVLVPYRCGRCALRCGLILVLARDLGRPLPAPAPRAPFLLLLSLVELSAALVGLPTL